MQEFCKNISEKNNFQYFFLSIIVLAGVVVGMETYPGMVERHGTILHLLDKIILWFFVLEIAIKMIAHGRKFLHFFNDGWNVFDFIIVAACFLPFDGESIIVIRLLRVLRVLRLIKAIPDLKILVNTLLRSIPPMGYVSLLVSLLFYVYAVMGTFIFRANDPVHFGDLHHSMLSLFRVVTLEDWTDVMYIAMYGCDNYGYSGNEAMCTNPEAFPVLGWVFFVSFVMLGTFVLFNLLIGIIIGKMEDSRTEEHDEEEMDRLSHVKKNDILNVIHNLKGDLANLEKHVHALELVEDKKYHYADDEKKEK